MIPRLLQLGEHVTLCLVGTGWPFQNIIPYFQLLLAKCKRFPGGSCCSWFRCLPTSPARDHRWHRSSCNAAGFLALLFPNKTAEVLPGRGNPECFYYANKPILQFHAQTIKWLLASSPSLSSYEPGLHMSNAASLWG